MRAKLLAWILLSCIGIATHAATAPTATFSTLTANPAGPLVEGEHGRFFFFGVAGHGDDLNAVFKFTPAGKVALVARFTERDGRDPTGLLLASDGNLYGTFQNDTRYSVHASGSVFKLTQAGNLTTLHLFAGGNEGSGPTTGLIQGRDGNFYGTTQSGGTGDFGFGTIFKITPAGQLTTLHAFAGGEDGWSPRDNLIEANDGNFYGTTPFSAGYGGTIYKISPSGQKTTLHQFKKNDGEPSGLIQGHDGNLYGTTTMGTVQRGSIFRITLAGELTPLYVFSLRGGSAPNSGLVEGNDGSLYGTTDPGGSLVPGTVFRLDTSGHLTTLHEFRDNEGTVPNGLVLARDGNLYGSTEKVFFRLTLGQP